MRIIAGRFKGHRIISPGGERVRPTTDRVREAIFSHVGDSVVEARVLELFAGTGAFGFEALSRGAQSVYFVEKDSPIAQFPRRMAEKLGVQDSVSILELDALTALKTLARRREKFNIVFLDPPYESDWILRLTACPELWKLPEPGGLIIVERQAGSRDLSVPQDLRKRLSRTYGGTLIEVFETTIPE